MTFIRRTGTPSTASPKKESSRRTSVNKSIDEEEADDEVLDISKKKVLNSTKSLKVKLEVQQLAQCVVIL